VQKIISKGPATEDTVYEPVPRWPDLPAGYSFKEATSVGVDHQDRIYVFNRGEHPMMVFDREGQLLSKWGEGEFVRPHGVSVDSEGYLYLADDMGHFVRKTTMDGEEIMTIGTPNKAAAWQGGKPFNRPTHCAVHPVTGDLFISDGYGNSRVHKFDSEGQLIMSWGTSGSDPGEFSLPHNIAMLDDERVVVCDRENFRLQVFTTSGEFVTERSMHRPMSICAGRGLDTNLYVGEGGAHPPQEGVPNLGQRVSILDRDLNLVARFGNSVAGEGPDQFLAAHGIAVDSRGDVYVAEVSWTAYGSKLDPPREVISLRKWRRVQD